jgi:hypothetical protein
MSSIFVNSYSHKFTPYSVPGLKSWFDARFGVYSTLAIPDSSATVNGTGFPNNFSNTNGEVDTNGVFGYVLRPGSGRTFGVAKINNKWVYVSADSNYNDEDGTTYAPFVPVSPAIEAVGDTGYPWQATWPSEISVTRNGTTTGTLATSNQKVVRWENRLNTDEAFVQATLSRQPAFLNKEIYFNGVNILQYVHSFPDFMFQPIQYYVGLRNISATSSPGGTIIRAGATSTSSFNHRFAARILMSGQIAVNHSNSFYENTGITYTDNAGMNNRVYSFEFRSGFFARVFTDIYTMYPQDYYVGVESSLTSRFLLGGSGTGVTAGSMQGITGNISQVLIYQSTHTSEQRAKIMKYLRDNINNGYATEIEF